MTRSLIGITLFIVCQSIAVAEQSPNVVIILADDLGWRDVGYHGSEIETPRLDQLASEGVALERYYSQPSCSPTRAALMTGKSPLRLGVLRPISKLLETGLPLGEKLLPQYFKDAGYQTFMVGKWHLGFRKREYLPQARGFDHFYGHVTGGIGYWDHVHGGGLDWQRNGETAREEGYSTHLIANESIQLIKKREATAPMLLIASFNAPHLPNEAPEEAISQYKHIQDPFRQTHAAMVTELDTAIGGIVDALAEEGMLENTVIWFMSDNGGLNAESRPPQNVAMAEQLQAWYGKPIPLSWLEFVRTNALEGGSDNTPFRLGKNTVYEGGTRVPSIIYWKDKLAPRNTTHMVTVQDVLPTLLGAVRATVTAEFDGLNQWRAIAGDTLVDVADYITQFGGNFALYRYPWKLIVPTQGEPELYHLEQDPTERLNLASKQPLVVAELTEVLNVFPRGKSIHESVPLRAIVKDPDFFGGVEDRPPWSEIIEQCTAGTVSSLAFQL